MIQKVERFITFLRKEQTKAFLAFICYVSFIAMTFDLPSVLNVVTHIILTIAVVVAAIYWPIYLTNKLTYTKKFFKAIIKKLVKIAKEIIIFIPIWIISGYIVSLFIRTGQPANETSIEATFCEAPLMNAIFIIILGPILEEIIFRLLPSKFLKNKFLYVIITAVIFAGMHVVNDPNPLYYIWCYMPNALYLGYRYYKTRDIYVTISLHMFNNIIASLPLILSVV